MKEHNMLESQTNVYVPTFMKILLFQAYCKQNIRLKLGNHKHTDADPRKYCAHKKSVRHFLLYEHLQIFWHGNTLTNKYCKTGVLEHTLLRTWFVSDCMYVSYLTRTVLLMLHVHEMRLYSRSYISQQDRFGYSSGGKIINYIL